MSNISNENYTAADKEYGDLRDYR